ncbi:MAG: flagellar biosynthesis anti-sigma factor FlgM [bacterium]
MSIEGVTSAQIIQKLKGIEESSQKGTGEAGGAQRSDEVNISNDARLAQTLKRSMDAIENTPEVREDRVAEVQERLESGFYDQEQVVEQAADQLTSVFLGE